MKYYLKEFDFLKKLHGIFREKEFEGLLKKVKHFKVVKD